MQSCYSFTPKRCSLPHQPPLPIFKPSDSGLPETLKHRYIGKYDGFSVIVENLQDMIDLHTMGYFGKGSLSSGYPSFCKKRKTDESGDIASTSTKDEVPMDNSSCTATQETLNLMLEEAFFLSYALGILDVYFNDEIMKNEEMWRKFQDIAPNFVPRYVAYHHFRSKGWVVRPGIKFSGDFTLYKEGPPFYHASFVVHIIFNLNDAEKNQGFRPFLAYDRAIEVVNKDLLICQIIAPKNFRKECFDDMEKFKVSEYLFKRWEPSENRE